MAEKKVVLTKRVIEVVVTQDYRQVRTQFGSVVFRGKGETVKTKECYACIIRENKIVLKKGLALVKGQTAKPAKELKVPAPDEENPEGTDPVTESSQDIPEDEEEGKKK